MAKKPAFEAFYRANVKRIYAFVFFRVGSDKALAEDLVQDIFMKAFEAYDRYDPERGISAWIYTIARNHVINEMTKRRPGVPIEEIEDSIRVSTDAREREALKDDERRLLAALDRLDVEDARLLRMKHLEGWSYDELADIFEKTPGTLRVQASRAMKKLKSLIKL
ncbi:MAG TPA: sigma-70 family RNA polymerase sigma factor [Verrucomicrobiae bacterium]|nr:sigma-70 family RNA polymerase sigma factor [Verrucomicrobiae bacterium]